MAKKKLMPAADWREERTRKFQILVSANFTCVYCGSRPGSDRLHVDHLVPVSKGGSNENENLCCACETCNLRKSNAIIFPPSMVEGEDADGWRIHRTFGQWAVLFDENNIVIERVGLSYWFPVSHLYEEHIQQHLAQKKSGWAPETWDDLCRCAQYACRLVRDPKASKRERS